VSAVNTKTQTRSVAAQEAAKITHRHEVRGPYL
jgi:hypothetical protein